MSQPFDRGCSLNAPGDVDSDLGEFWSESSWTIPFQHNLSFFERNRAFLNIGGHHFLDISHLTGADTDGDGRAVVAADFNYDGMQDLLVRQVGGGALLLFENRFPQQNYLRVSLRGTKSNRLGIGARLTAYVEGRPVVRELYPINSFQSQAPSMIHFGLATGEQVDKLVIRWPSRETQEFSNLGKNQHLLLEEGSPDIQVIQPGQAYQP